MKTKKKYGNNTKYFDEDKWEEVNPNNKYMIEEFLSSKRNLSKASIKQYTCTLRIFLIFIFDSLNNKDISELKKRDMLRFQNWMLDSGLSAGSAKTRRSHVSSLFNFIVDYYEDEEEWIGWKNQTVGLEPLNGEPVHEKEPMNLKEVKILRKELIKLERWQQLAYFDISFSTAGRRGEIHQLRKEIVNGEKNDKGYYSTHPVTLKGGKEARLNFSQEAMDSMKKWIEVRGKDEVEDLFVTIDKDGAVKKINETTFNYWCSTLFTDIIGRRVHPHSFRAARATSLVVEEGRDISSAQHLLNHLDSSTTSQHYVIRDSDDSINDCF